MNHHQIAHSAVLPVLLTATSLWPSTASSQGRYRKVRIPISSREDFRAIGQLGIDLEGGFDGNSKSIDLFVDEREARLLSTNGIPFTTLIPD